MAVEREREGYNILPTKNGISIDVRFGVKGNTTHHFRRFVKHVACRRIKEGNGERERKKERKKK